MKSYKMNQNVFDFLSDQWHRYSSANGAAEKQNQIDQEFKMNEVSKTESQMMFSECMDISKDMDDVIVDKYSITLRRKAVVLFRPGVWLNDECINFYMQHLQADSDYNNKKCHFFCTFLMELLLSTNKKRGISQQYNHEQVKRWTKSLDPTKLDKIFMPINISQYHWILIVIYVKHKRIHLYDSLYRSNNAYNDKYLNAALKWIEDEYTQRKVHINMTEWSKCQGMPGIPQQPNGFDCGIYVMLFARLIYVNMPLTSLYFHDSNAFRMRLLLDILNERSDNNRKEPNKEDDVQYVSPKNVVRKKLFSSEDKDSFHTQSQPHSEPAAETHADESSEDKVTVSDVQYSSPASKTVIVKQPLFSSDDNNDSTQAQSEQPWEPAANTPSSIALKSPLMKSFTRSSHLFNDKSTPDVEFGETKDDTFNNLDADLESELTSKHAMSKPVTKSPYELRAEELERENVEDFMSYKSTTRTSPRGAKKKKQ